MRTGCSTKSIAGSGRACYKAGLVYSRYVDDITISGPFNLKHSGFARVVREILEENGFSVNPGKNAWGRLDEGTTITGIRLREGRLDVRQGFLAEVERQLHDAAVLASGEGELVPGPYFTSDQILGRIEFIGSIQYERRKSPIRLYRTIDWNQVEDVAARRGLVAAKKRLVQIADSARTFQGNSG